MLHMPDPFMLCRQIDDSSNSANWSVTESNNTVFENEIFWIHGCESQVSRTVTTTCGGFLVSYNYRMLK